MVVAWLARIEGGPKRVNHVAVLMDSRIYIMGGYYHGLEFAEFPNIEIHVFSLDTQQWSKLNLTEEQNIKAPYFRYGHTAVGYGTGIYLFGGRDDQGACNELFRFDCETHFWARMNCSGRPPLPCDGHSSCLVGNRMYVFGGFTDEPHNIFATGLWYIDLDTYIWEKVSTQGKEPDCRDFHSAVCLGKSMFVYGGRGTNQPPFHSPNVTYPTDLHEFDTTTRTWSLVTPRTSYRPDGRRSQSMFVLDDNLYMFGGYNCQLEKHFNDLHRFDTVTRCWHYVYTLGDPPCPRRRQACVMYENNVYLHGGTSPDESLSRHQPEGGEEDEERLVDHGDMFILDLRVKLKALCIKVIVAERLDLESLPKHLAQEISSWLNIERQRQEPRQFPSA